MSDKNYCIKHGVVVGSLTLPGMGDGEGFCPVCLREFLERNSVTILAETPPPLIEQPAVEQPAVEQPADLGAAGSSANVHVGGSAFVGSTGAQVETDEERNARLSATLSSSLSNSDQGQQSAGTSGTINTGS